jgi:F-type H+-transporting ATPase subunit b
MTRYLKPWIREERHFVGCTPDVKMFQPSFRGGTMGGTVIANAIDSWSSMSLLATANSEASFMDSLPDPMKLQLPVVAFVVVLLILLFVFLKFMLFKPLTKVMDDRESAIRTGTASKTEAAAQIEARQADYAARLKDLRGQAFEHRKALAAAVSMEKQGILDVARKNAFEQRTQALADLKVEQKAAEADLRAQVEALSESMVQHLLKQA